eukprot:scaffold3461_cov61-Phaeocystis_antarctica.AAC.2
MPRLDQLEDPLVRLLGCAAQRRARGGELPALRKVQHSWRRAADHALKEGGEVEQLIGAQHALLERDLLGPAVAAALLGFALLIPVARVGGHGARHARARVETVGERAAEGREREVVVEAACEWHVQVAFRHQVVEHRDVGEQVVAHLVLVGEEEAARGHLAVQEDRPVGETTLAASGAAGPAPAELDIRGSTGSSVPGFSYTVRTAAKESDQLMSSSCRTTTTWRFRRSTSFFSMAASILAPAQRGLAVASACWLGPVIPQLQGTLASTVTPFCDTEPSGGLHCHVDGASKGEVGLSS